MEGIPESLLELVRGQLSGERIDRCPRCGSFFDAPRTNPATGNLARKCAACAEWYPVGGKRRPDRRDGAGDESGDDEARD